MIQIVLTSYVLTLFSFSLLKRLVSGIAMSKTDDDDV